MPLISIDLSVFTTDAHSQAPIFLFSYKKEVNAQIFIMSPAPTHTEQRQIDSEEKTPEEIQGGDRVIRGIAKSQKGEKMKVWSVTVSLL